jgi:NSS family neurotransmitter:Na+ symporter
MIELASRVLIDFGVTRRRAIQLVGAAGFLLGLPSALSIEFFRNQDWVWSVGLMLSGLFFALAVLRYGVNRFRTHLVNRDGSDMRIGAGWNVVMVFVVLEAIVLLLWWLSQAVDRADLTGSLTPFSPFNVGTVLIQGGIVLTVLLLLNRRMARPFGAGNGGAGDGNPEP